MTEMDPDFASRIEAAKADLQAERARQQAEANAGIARAEEARRETEDRLHRLVPLAYRIAEQLRPHASPTVEAVRVSEPTRFLGRTYGGYKQTPLFLGWKIARYVSFETSYYSSSDSRVGSGRASAPIIEAVSLGTDGWLRAYAIARNTPGSPSTTDYRRLVPYAFGDDPNLRLVSREPVRHVNGQPDLHVITPNTPYPLPTLGNGKNGMNEKPMFASPAVIERGLIALAAAGNVTL